MLRKGLAALDNRMAMEMALDAGAAVRTRTSPNPWVGAVVLAADGEVVGVGATEPPGGPHAEVVALGLAGDRAVGGTLVVTLEPCAHHGRTPPCVDTIIRANVARVIVAVEDPDPRVAGRGIAGLLAAGIDVEAGVLAEAATRQLEPYLHRRRTGRPFVVCKLAISVDGRIAAAMAPRVGSPGPKRALTHTCCGPRATRSSSVPARSDETIHR